MLLTTLKNNNTNHQFTLKFVSIGLSSILSYSILEIIVNAFAKERKILQLNVSLQSQINFKYDVTIKALPKPKTSNDCVEIHHCSAHDIPAVILYKSNIKHNTIY